MFKESAIVVHRNSIISYSVGTATSVEFDFLGVWEYVKKLGCEPSELFFYHVHPQGFDKYSSTDLNCMEGLVIGFGDFLNFSIICFEKDDLLSIEHIQKSYYTTGILKGKVLEDRNKPLTPDQLLFLKYLSYS